MMREKSDRRLWHRLEGYSFHERPLKRSLVDRLGEETGHSVDVCYTLIEEYRRFMYLVGSSAYDLRPSPIVDLVWRLHVEDRDAYFGDFCPRVIGRTIHHGSDATPLNEDPAYERTLAFYAEEFGRPQVQYWPDPDTATVSLSTGIMWTVGVAAFALAVIFSSILFATFGAFVICASMFLRWKYTSLPLRIQNTEA